MTITDFLLFNQTTDVITKFGFQEQTKNFAYPDTELQLIFIELPKFKKELLELTSLSERWIYFIKEAATLDEIPERLGEVSEISLALNIANQANMTVEELESLQRRGMVLQDEKGRLTYAREEGREEGEKAGEEKGRLAQARDLVTRLLTKRFGEISAVITSQIENLSIQDLENLGEDFLDFNSLEDLEEWLKLD